MGSNARPNEQRFAFAFEARYRPLLLAFGVVPATAWVVLTDEWLSAHFGPWTCRSPIANIVDVQVSGPYRPWRAIGTRLSFADRGLTFGSTTEGGVCVCFRDPVPGIDPLGRTKHPGLTVTVEDRDTFAAAVRARAGLT